MPTVEAIAQAKLREIVPDLDAIRLRLLEVHASLPVPPDELAMLVGEEAMDVSTEVRTVIECVLHDWLRPAIDDLQAAAAYQPERADVETRQAG